MESMRAWQPPPPARFRDRCDGGAEPGGGGDSESSRRAARAARVGLLLALLARRRAASCVPPLPPLAITFRFCELPTAHTMLQDICNS